MLPLAEEVVLWTGNHPADTTPVWVPIRGPGKVKLASTDFYLEHKMHSNHGSLVEGDSLLFHGSLTRGWGAKGFSTPDDLSHGGWKCLLPTDGIHIQSRAAGTNSYYMDSSSFGVFLPFERVTGTDQITLALPPWNIRAPATIQ